VQFPRVAGAAGLATATALAFVPGSATAAPPSSPDDVARQIAVLDVQAETATEDYAQAQLALTEAQRSSAALTARIAEEQAHLDEVRGDLSSLVAATYRRGGNNRLVSLLTDSSPQSFLDRAASLDRIARSQADVLAAAATARHRLDAAQVEAARELAAQEQAAASVAEQKERIEATLAEQRTILSRLQEQERQRVEAARLAAQAPAPQAAAPARASRDRAAVPAAAPAAAAAAPTYSGPASGRAAIAVQEAYARLGTPYQWAASGPNRFDCSGLTSWVWRKAGVSLPHSSRAQYAGGRKVSRAEIQPGDLVFHGSPIHHVGIYVGDGNMISAPRTGDVVKIQAAFRSDFVGAVRVG
jgi:cell wall-associated NlpC family hydrolase